MQAFDKILYKRAPAAVAGAFLLMAQAAWAESDMQKQERVLKQREMNMQAGADHYKHQAPADDSELFRGVFYGYLPCELKDCDGFKMTLSLKQKYNYLLVTQYAKESSREYYDKGKYVWDDSAKSLTLTSSKDGNSRRFVIKDEVTLIQVNPDGKPMPGDQDDYTLRRSDKSKTRDVHIH